MTKVTGIFDLGPYDPPLHSASEQAANVVKDFAQAAAKTLSEMEHGVAAGAGSHTAAAAAAAYPLHESPMTVSFDAGGSMCPPQPSSAETIMDLLLKLLPSDWMDFIGNIFLCVLTVLTAFAIWWVMTKIRDYLSPPARTTARSLGQRAVIIQSTDYTPASDYMY
jgi:hypothetical protein